MDSNIRLIINQIKRKKKELRITYEKIAEEIGTNPAQLRMAISRGVMSQEQAQQIVLLLARKQQELDGVLKLIRPKEAVLISDYADLLNYIEDHLEELAQLAEFRQICEKVLQEAP